MDRATSILDFKTLHTLDGGGVMLLGADLPLASDTLGADAKLVFLDHLLNIYGKDSNKVRIS